MLQIPAKVADRSPTRQQGNQLFDDHSLPDAASLRVRQQPVAVLDVQQRGEDAAVA